MSDQKLAQLHRYNGWNWLFLLVSGVILYHPALRGPLSAYRGLLRNLHILCGVASLGLLLAYRAHVSDHWRRLGRRTTQKLNVIWIGVLLIGWGLTGTILWLHLWLPVSWSDTALVWHGRLTWFALPWASGHAVVRYFVRRVPQIVVGGTDRRAFLATAGVALGAIAWTALGRKLGVPGLRSERRASAPHSERPMDPDTNFAPPVLSRPPEGGGGKGRFEVFTVTPIPTAHVSEWNFRVSGLVDRPVTLTWEEFLQLPRTVQVSDFHCVTGWSVYHVTWEGVRVSDLLDHVGVAPGARFVKFVSGDGVYTDSLSLQVARGEDVILAYVMDGSPLPTPLGGPVRLIVPKMYGYKSVKWVHGVELINMPQAGYWEERGYPDEAWVKDLAGGA